MDVPCSADVTLKWDLEHPANIGIDAWFDCCMLPSCGM
jgi:hypothetical protein